MQYLAILFLLLTSICSAAEKPSGAILEGAIHTSPNNPERNTLLKIYPGSVINLSATVKNSGDKPNTSGTIYIRFALKPPFQNNPYYTIFETEMEPLPELSPNESIQITFSQPHVWPSFLDYLRNDWHMRQYEVVTIIHNKPQIIATSTINVSAQYSPGPSTPAPTHVE